MVSESAKATALFLLIAEGHEQEAAIDFLIRGRVWDQSLSDTAALVYCLFRRGEANLARDISLKALQTRKWATMGDRGRDQEAPSELVLKRGLSWLHPTGVGMLSAMLVKSFLRFTDSGYWADRSSQVYSLVPQILAPLTSDPAERDKLKEVLSLALNSDGSCGGLTAPTIICAYMLRELGDDNGFRKASGWVRQLLNPSGSLLPLLFQDVYDTAWTSIYFAPGSMADESISWLGRTGTDQKGYPYFSTGYHPDCDDSALVLLARQVSGSNYSRDGLANLLISGQNPDGGWSFVSFWTLRRALPYRIFAKHSSLIRKAVSRYGDRLFWSPNFDSSIDMTSRVMIALATEPNSLSKKRAIAAGTRYLQRNRRSGLYHGPNRWVDSHAFESSLAIVAMNLNKVADAGATDTMERLLSLPLTGADAAAHVLWASLSAGAPADRYAHIVNYLLSTQNEDGTWPPTLRFKAYSRFFDPLFSTIIPMLSLKAVAQS